MSSLRTRTSTVVMYTSFVTEYGGFEFCVVSFSITFASGLCNRVMNEILEYCKPFVTTFVDDLMLAAVVLKNM